MTNIINDNYYTLIFFMIAIIIIGIILILISLLKNKKDNIIENTNLKIDDDKKEQLTKDIFNIYKKVEVAKSKFDYDTLKELLTEELYIEEEQKLNNYRANKQKLIKTNIKLQEIKILSIKTKDEKDTINAYLHVSQYNYIVNNKKEIIRGTDKEIYQIEYQITIEKTNKYSKIKNLKCTGKWIKNI